MLKASFVGDYMKVMRKHFRAMEIMLVLFASTIGIVRVYGFYINMRNHVVISINSHCVNALLFPIQTADD